MLVLHYDVVSPPAAVAVLRLQRIAEDGADVRFSGVDPVGLDVSVPATLEQLDGFERWQGEAAALGLRMRRPRVRPPTLRAHLVGELAERAGVGARWRATCLRAYWTDQADLADLDVLAELAGEAGLDRSMVRRHLDDRAELAAARQRAAAIHRRGVGGVPVLEAHGTFVSAHLDDPTLRRLAQW